MRWNANNNAAIEMVGTIDCTGHGRVVILHRPNELSRSYIMTFPKADPSTHNPRA